MYNDTSKTGTNMDKNNSIPVPGTDIDTTQSQFQDQKDSKSNNNRPIIPSKQMEQLKQETAASLGIDLTKDNLTAKEAGKVGGNMVKKMIQNYENSAANQSQNK